MKKFTLGKQYLDLLLMQKKTQELKVIKAISEVFELYESEILNLAKNTQDFFYFPNIHINHEILILNKTISQYGFQAKGPLLTLKNIQYPKFIQTHFEMSNGYYHGYKIVCKESWYKNIWNWFINI